MMSTLNLEKMVKNIFVAQFFISYISLGDRVIVNFPPTVQQGGNDVMELRESRP